jgi:5-oxoprolinase (ATP-hydrolysing)
MRITIGTDTALMVLPNDKDGQGNEDFEAAFNRVYKSEFGFLLDTKSVIVDDVKVCSSPTSINTVHSPPVPLLAQVRGIGKTFDSLGHTVYTELASLRASNKISRVSPGNADSQYSVYFDKVGRVGDTPVFLLDKLNVGNEVVGPAVVIDDTQTIVLVPGSTAVFTSRHLYITLE